MLSNIKFDLNKPCESCPFLKDVNSNLKTIKKIAIVDKLTKNDYRVTCKDQSSSFCAGALIIMKKNNQLSDNSFIRANKLMGYFNESELDLNSNVYENFSDFIRSK